VVTSAWKFSWHTKSTEKALIIPRRQLYTAMPDDHSEEKEIGFVPCVWAGMCKKEDI